MYSDCALAGNQGLGRDPALGGPRRRPLPEGTYEPAEYRSSLVGRSPSLVWEGASRGVSRSFTRALVAAGGCVAVTPRTQRDTLPPTSLLRAAATLAPREPPPHDLRTRVPVTWAGPRLGRLRPRGDLRGPDSLTPTGPSPSRSDCGAGRRSKTTEPERLRLCTEPGAAPLHGC